MTGPVAPRLDPILKLAQIEPHYVGPDHAREMVFPDQAVDIHRAQLDLVAFGLAKARRARWCGFALWLCAFREPFKKLVASHRSPHANQPSQGITAGPASAMLQLSFAKDSQPLRVTSGFGFSCPLARMRTPRMRFLYVRPALCLQLPSDPASRRRPCCSANGSHHQGP